MHYLDSCNQPLLEVDRAEAQTFLLYQFSLRCSLEIKHPDHCDGLAGCFACC